MRKLLLAVSAATLTVPALSVPTISATAMAHDNGSYHSHGKRGGYEGRSWRGRNGQAHCRKSDGTVGLLVGGAAGALAGREIDKRGSRTTGTVLGAAVGALLGRHVQRNVISKRCR